MSALNVELYGVLLGTLSRAANEGERFAFQVCPEAIGKYSLSSTIMSLAVPLNLRFTPAQKRRGVNYFTELLPEGRNYEWLANSLPPGERTPYDILRKYGKDIAGALIIYDPDDPSSAKKGRSEIVDGKEIRRLFERMPLEALANSPVSGKTSLGGVQGKIVLAKKEASWRRVHYGCPSTHILKPFVPEYPTMIYDEAFCMNAAQKAGLTGHPVWIECFDGVDALVIERYDRDAGIAGGRIHQEDFNQALGARGNEKYQEYGGKVSAKNIAYMLARFGGRGDVEKFASHLIFAITIGNLDMHAKNVSVLHFPDESARLAPVYDQVPLRHQNTDGRMAFSIGGEYVHKNLSVENIVSELTSWGYPGFSGKAETAGFIETCLHSYSRALNDTALHKNAYPGLKNCLSLFIGNLLSGKRIGG